MNFTTNLDKIGEFSMQNLILIGIFAVICLLIWQLGNIINAIANLIKIKNEINKEQNDNF